VESGNGVTEIVYRGRRAVVRTTCIPLEKEKDFLELHTPQRQRVDQTVAGERTK
jgi:hypothetical protein